MTATLDTTTPPPARIYRFPGVDDYGRRTIAVKVNSRTVAMIVRLPRSWTEKHPDERYLVNDWTQPIYTEGKVTYWPSPDSASTYANSIADREVERLAQPGAQRPRFSLTSATGTASTICPDLAEQLIAAGFTALATSFEPRQEPIPCHHCTEDH